MGNTKRDLKWVAVAAIAFTFAPPVGAFIFGFWFMLIISEIGKDEWRTRPWEKELERKDEKTT